MDACSKDFVRLALVGKTDNSEGGGGNYCVEVEDNNEGREDDLRQ